MFTVDVEMNRVFARLLTSTLTALAISLGSVAIFVLPQGVVAAQEEHSRGQDRVPTDSPSKSRFLSALKAYKAQRYTAAKGELEPLVKSAPDNFEVNELLGLVYVAQDKQAEANRFLAKAVQLKPNVVEARTALATNLLALRRENEAELQFKKIVALEPQSYDANHNLGEFYIQTGKVANAIPFLKRAQEIDPAAYNNGYDLALALEQSGELAEARERIQGLISLRDSAELHSLLGEVEEKSRAYLTSAKQYEQAARMEPSEQNVLNWGAELLLHQTFAPAIEVFQAGTQRFPQSAPLHNGLGIAFYGAGQLDDAARSFFQASDLNPKDPLPLTFLGKACDGVSAALAAQIRSRLQSFVTGNTQNAEVTYYDAICLWRMNQTELKPELNVQTESLLKRAVAVDPNYSDAYFQLGILYSDQHKYSEAVEQFERALKINPDSANAHYRLGQALARLGNETRAHEEFAVFERLRKSESDETITKQNQIQQFVYTMRKSDPNPQ